MSQLMKKRFPSITSIDVESDGNTSFLRAARNGQLDKVLEHLKSNIDINTSNANGLNALHLASKDGHVEIVEELLKRGAVVDAATKKGNTALHIASLAGQEEVVKLLVQHGASVNVQSQNGFTPLYMAAQENHDNVVKYLLANGANQSLSTEDGFTPLAVAMQQGHEKVVTVLLENDTRGKIRLPALHIAAKKDDVKAAKLLLENEHNPDVTSKSGFTPLHIASHYGNQQIANLLTQKGADVNYAAKHNITPLHVAAKWGKTNMVALLLEHGATIESKTRDGLTPLHCAARSGHEQVVDMLLERGAPISSKTKNGLAPLHMAAQGDHVDAARILLYHRAPVDEVTVDYLTALHVAAHCGHVRVAKLLLDRQADANARALNGFTPLHIACKKNRIKVVELLLKHGASIGATTESGLTPLHVASFMGCMNIVIYLLQHDANPDVPTVRGETPLHLAARANQTDIIRILLRNGAQVDARAREQQTPLHIASRLGNVDIVMLLLQHGAKVDNTTKDMYTALHIAAKEGQDEVAAVLLDNGASLDATTKKGFTPLHLAAKYGHLKVAKLLLQKEAPVDAQGKNGVTPLHVASHYDHQNVALLLLDKGASPHATAKNGHTPLHIAARKNQMDIANTLLEYGAQPNAESKAGFTPLHLSAQEGHADMSSLLLEHKADANFEAKNGLTPLHLCAQEDRVPVAEILVKNGADVNAATKGGYTPLHIASHYGQTNMVRFLLQNGANVKSTTSLDYTPLHQAAQQGHANIVNILLENSADPNAVTTNGQTPLNIAQKLGYITVIETLKVVTTTTTITTTTTTNIEEKYKVQAPELMHETFMSDSEEEGGEDTVLGDQTYKYLTADEMKSLGDDSLPIDVTRDERIDSNRMVSSGDSNMLPPQHIEDSISPEHVTQNYVEYIKKYTPDNVDVGRHPINIGFLVSFLVDARGGAMRGCRHSGVRVIVPPRCAPSPTRITCRYVRPQRTPHPPPLMEGEALASRVLELGPVGAKFLGPVIIEVPHFAALRGKEREIVILRSDNGESWKEHTVEATEEVLNEVLHDSFEAEDLNQLEDMSSGRITRILTQDFPQYFAVVSRIRQEVHAIGPEGGMVSSTVVPQVQAVFPEGALTKKIKVGLQAQPIDPELTAKLLGHGVAVSPVVTVEPRRRKFHKAITLSMPAPRAHSQGMINQYSGSAPTLRLLCSITGGTTRAQWEDVTGSTPLTFVNDCVSFTTTVSARFWLMDCRNIGDATKMATELYKEAIHVPFMAKFVVFAKRVDPLEARLRVFCMTDDKEDKTLEHQEHFTEVAKSRDVEVLEGKLQYVEFAGNLVPITKSGEHLSFSFRAFRENRLPFSVKVKDQHAEAVSRCLFMKESKVPKGEPPQQPICILNIVLPDDIVMDTISLTDTDSLKKHTFLSENFDYYRPDPRLADMSNLLGEDWVSLANQLGLTTSEINVIKSEYPDSVAKQAQSMLRMWLSQSGNKAQTNTLENALRRIGRENIIPQCLNVDHTGQTITRIKQEEIGKYRLKKDIDIIDTEVVTRGDIGDERVMVDKQDVKRKLDTYDKYSAEEKEIEVSDEEEEEAFDKPVAERREQIEKRLSAERTIPASSQRREIVQEITSIKRQSIVEDKIAEVQQKTTPEQKTTLEQTKTTPEETKTTHEQIKTTTSTIITVSPETKTLLETVEMKTTIPSDSKVSETVKVPSLQKIHEDKITTVTETRTIQPEETTHRTTDDVELLEGVTQSLEKKKPILIADEDPKSPKFSKTPPPSPADFLIREQAATVQKWDASRKPAEPESKTIGQVAAQQGKTTSTAHYLVSNEELSLVQIPVDATITGLYARDNNLVDLNPIYYQTNAFIQSESQAEPYHCHTEKYYKIDQENKDDKHDLTKTTSGKDEKKRKKGILGTIKTFVGKSLDHSDSESEKSPKKEKKIKKEKNKVKISNEELPPEIPARPPRKPKLPTPTEDHKYADIPYFEAASAENGTNKSAEIPTRESTPFNKKDESFQLSEIASNTPTITDLDEADLNVSESIKNQAAEIVTDVIIDSEKVVTEQLSQKSPKSKKRKVIVVEETVFKTFTPASVEEEEFTIIIDPTKIGSPQKTRETFTLNIDESIDKIEKEILEKSPILPDEKLIKPSAQIEGPVRPPRIKDHLYEDIEEPIISHQDNLMGVPEYFNFPHPDDIKTATTDLINNEMEFTGWQDDKYNLFNVNKLENKEETKEKLTDSQKMKRKHGKLFVLFGKMSKDGDDSDEYNRKEVIEKHDKETSKEQKAKIEVQKSPKLKKSKSKEKPEKIETEDSDTQMSPKKIKGRDKEEKGFLGLFKKGKKDDVSVKQVFSESVIKEMIDSTAFLKEEVDKYYDVKPIIVDEIRKGADILENKSKQEKRIIEEKHIYEESLADMQKTESFLKDEIETYHDVRPFTNVADTDNKQNGDEIISTSSTIEEKVLKLEKTKDKLVLSEDSRDMDAKHRTEVNVSIKKQKENIVERTGLFGLFKKKTSEEKEIEPKIEKTKDKPTLSERTKNDMQNSKSFLNNEIKIYHDVRPIVQCTIVTEEQKIATEIPKSEHKEEGTRLFGLFKKKSVDKEFEHKKEKTKDISVLPETTTRYMQEKDSFLRDEVKIYHDVRPINEEAAISKKMKIGTDETKKEHKNDGRGFFGLFKKKTSEEREIEQENRPVLSENVLKNMQESDSFLKDEIKMYHDVRPVSQEPFISDDNVLTDHPTVFFGLFKKKPSEEKEIESKIEKIKESPVLSEYTVRNMHETDSVLTSKVQIYHDVKPAIQVTSTPIELETASKKLREEDADDGKGFFGLFKNKSSDEKDIAVKIKKTKDTPQSTLINMQDSDSFLKDEIKMYHDVRPIIQKSTDNDSIDKPKQEKKDDVTVFFGFFKKKSSEDKDTEHKIENLEERSVLSENTIREIHETDSFLRDEVRIYHDVLPIVQEITVSKEVVMSSENAKGEDKDNVKVFPGILNNKSSEKNDIELEVGKIKERPLSDNTMRDMQESDSFLRDEVKIYHDVRPIVQETATLKEVKIFSEKPKGKYEEDGTGFFGLCKKETLEETNIEPKLEKIKERPILSESTIKDMQETVSFLIDEVKMYHDVRPINQEAVTLKEVKISSEKPKGKDKEDGKGFLGFFKKKSSEERFIEPKVEKIKERSVLSKNTIRDMQETDSFLRDEIKVYHDVRPIDQETAAMKEAKIYSEEQKKKDKEDRAGFLGLFKKKTLEETDIEPKIERIKERPVLSENTIKDIEETDSFLRDEIKIYHDVRPTVQETATLKEAKISSDKSKGKDTEDRTGFLGLFKKKTLEETDIEPKIEEIKERPVLSENTIKDMQETDSFLRDEIKIYHDVRPIVQETATLKEAKISSDKSKGKDTEDRIGFLGLFKKKTLEETDIEPKIEGIKERPVLSENTIKDIQETDSFLKDEIKIYHDVRPIVQQTATLKEAKISSEKSKGKDTEDRTRFLGLFKKKILEETDIEPMVERIKERPILSESTIKDMQETDSFLTDEVKMYHDVCPINQEAVTMKEIKISSEKPKAKDKEDGAGFRGLFKNKSSEERSIEPKVERIKVRSVLSENTIKDMKESDSFLRDEIKIYHDVRPIVQETATLKEVNISSEKPKGKDKENGTGFLRLFKKKTFDEKDTEKDQPILSENTLKNMQESDSFLKDEIKTYHDVRPIIQEKAISNEEKTTDEKLEIEHKDDEKSLFGLFKKKASIVKEIKPKVDGRKNNILSDSTLKGMKESDSFLKDEIKVYHDVRPIVQESITTELQALTDKSKLETSDGQTGFFGLFKRKSENKDTEKVVNDENKKDILKSKKGKKINLRKDVTKQHPLSATAIKDISDSKTFLKEEVDKYEDFPFTLQTHSYSVKTGATEDTDKKEEVGKKKESKGIFGEKKQNDIGAETYSEVKNIHETTNFLNTELERYEDAKLSPKTEIESKEINLIDIPVKIEQDSNVRLEPTAVKSEQTPSKGAKLFGIFGKKKSQDRENSIEKEKEKNKSKSDSGDFSVSIKGTQIVLQQEMPTEPPEDRPDSKNFPTGEIDRYHDAEIDIDKLSEMLPPETEEKSKEKSGGFFGLFSKKTKPKEINIKEKSVEKEDSTSQVIKNISDSDNFLQNEIIKYEDSHPITIPIEKVLDSSTKISSKHLISIQPNEESMPTFIEETNKDKIEINKKNAENNSLIDNESSKIEKHSTITTETVAFKDTLQLDPHILTDLSHLEEDIKAKIEQIHDETKIIDDTKPIVETESQLLHTIPYSFKTNVSDDIHMGTEQIICEEGILNVNEAKYISGDLKPHEGENTVDKKETVEKDKDKKTGIFAMFKRKSQSQDREPSEEKYTDKSEEQTNLAQSIQVKKEDRKNIGAPLKIFGKKQFSEEKSKQDIENYGIPKFSEMPENKEFKAHEQLKEELKKNEPKLNEVSEITLENIQNTKRFLSIEVENYEDGKPEIITDLDEDVDKIKSSGLFGIFSKKDKSESPKVMKRKFKKSKKSMEEVGIIEKIGRKLTGASSDSKEYIEDMSASIEENIYKTEKTTDKASKIPECIKNEAFESSQKPFDTEHDFKLKKVSFTDAKDNIIENVEILAEDKTNCTQSIINQEIPKEKIIAIKGITEKGLKAIETTSYEKIESSDDFFSETNKKLKKKSEEINRTLEETIDRANQKIKVKDAEKNDSKKVDVTQQTPEVVTKGDKDIVEKTVKKTGGFFSKFGEKIGTKGETVKGSIETTKEEAEKIEKESESKINDLKIQADDGTVINIDILDNSECPKNARDIVDANGKKDKKSKKSFFSKLGGKIGGKSDDVKDNTNGLKQNVADAQVLSEEQTKEIVSEDGKFHSIIKKTERTSEGTSETLSEKVTPDEQSLKYDSSSFVSEIMQSFEDTLEHVKDSGKELEESIEESVVGLQDTGVENLEKITTGATKQTGTFLEQVNEKFSATMKLTEEMSIESKQKIKSSLQDTQNFLQNEKEHIESNRIPIDNMKYSSIHGATETSDFFDCLGEFTNEKTKEVEDNVTEAFDGPRMRKENVEEGIAIAVQNVDDITEEFLTKHQEVKDSATDSDDVSKSNVRKQEDETEITKQADFFLKAVKGVETSKDEIDDTDNEVLVKQEILANKSNFKINADVEDGSEKTSKKSKRFLEKLGRKFSGKGDELKGKLCDESSGLEEIKGSDKKHKKSMGFFGKLGDKFIGKSEESKHDEDKEKSATEKIMRIDAGTVESYVSASKTPIKAESDEKKTEKPQIIFVEDTKNNFQDIKQATLDFIETECLHIDDSKMTRAMSDYGSKIKDSIEQSPRKISEANIDLSNLPANVDKYSKQADKVASSYVTSPTLTRRTVSQRFSKGERPEVIEVRNLDNDNISDDEPYIVTEPDEIFKQRDNFHAEIENRKPLFHLESEEDDNLDITNVKSERQDSTKSNILETLTELKIDSLISDLTKTLNEPLDANKPDISIKERQLEEHKKESEVDVELIEKKLSDLDKALESLERIDSQTETEANRDDAKTEKKLRRVERKFERMASEIINTDIKEGKEIKLTSPEVKEKQETEYRKLVSQLSTDEISDFQKEYSHLWDEHTFSKSDDWDSKTPDSQADAQELPQEGEEASSSTTPQPSTSVKAEGEETEKEESGSERRVTDQHQLSDEMKELLKELEKESKQ